MAGRSGDTFKKRQKEVARAEKHRENLARRLERKLLPKESPDSEEGTLAEQLSSEEDATQSEESGASQSIGAPFAFQFTNNKIATRRECERDRYCKVV